MHDSHFLESRSEFYRMLASRMNYLTRKELDIGWHHVGEHTSNIFVFPVNSPSQEAAIDRYMESLCTRLETQYPGTRFMTGKGQKGSKLSEIQKSFIHAKRCLMSTSLIPVTGKLISYQQLGFYQLLYEIPNAEYPKKYASEILEPLLTYDKENTSMLYETLCAYIRCGCNKVKTAKELYLHRNTLLGRLDKIEKLLDVSLEDTDVLFHLQAAIKINRFFTEI
jgi:DNA-binding PucR family transcriptional regulator